MEIAVKPEEVGLGRNIFPWEIGCGSTVERREKGGKRIQRVLTQLGVVKREPRKKRIFKTTLTQE